MSASHGSETQTVIEVAPAQSALQRPPQYKVVMLNDDFTPMDFVVEVLQKFFAMDHHKAIQTMLTVHTEGKAVCGTFRFEIAEAKAHQVVEYAKTNQHPLQCTIESA